MLTINYADGSYQILKDFGREFVPNQINLAKLVEAVAEGRPHTYVWLKGSKS